MLLIFFRGLSLLVGLLPVVIELPLSSSFQNGEWIHGELPISLHHFATGQHNSRVLLNQSGKVSELCMGGLQKIKSWVSGLLLSQFLQKLFGLISRNKLCSQFYRVEFNLGEICWNL